MKTIICYGIRHGERDGDKLTQKGRHQVSTSAWEYLDGLNPVIGYYSGLNRAYETLHEAMIAPVERNGVPQIHIEQGFGYALGEDRQLPGPSLEMFYREPPKPLQEQTVADWLEWCPGALVLRGQVTQALITIARDLEDGDTFIVASHSPTIELAAPIPAMMRRLGLADMVRYEIEIDGKGGGKIVLAQYLPCPCVEATEPQAADRFPVSTIDGPRTGGIC